MPDKILVTVHHRTKYKRQTGPADLFPVYLQVYWNQRLTGRKLKRLYPINANLSGVPGFEGYLSREDFKKSFLAKNPRGENNRLKSQIIKELSRAIDIVDKLQHFSYESFEQSYYREQDVADGLETYFLKYASRLRELDKIKTAKGYISSLNKLKEYAKFARLGSLNFSDVDQTFLEGFEHWYLNKSPQALAGRASINTVSIYLRNLRTIFNQAIDDGEISADLYPFGRKRRNRYKIPSSVNVKRSLSKAQVKQLYEVETKNDFEERAKVLWFLSFALQGINFKDLAELKKKNYTGQEIRFTRKKTLSTSRDAQEILIPVTNFAAKIIERAINLQPNGTDYLFPIYREPLNPEQKENRRRNIIKNVNDNLIKLCTRANIPFKVTTYYARHSYASIAKNDHVPTEVIKQSLGHTSVKTTENYLKNLPDQVMKDYADKIQSFLN